MQWVHLGTAQQQQQQQQTTAGRLRRGVSDQLATFPADPPEESPLPRISSRATVELNSDQPGTVGHPDHIVAV